MIFEVISIVGKLEIFVNYIYVEFCLHEDKVLNKTKNEFDWKLVVFNSQAKYIKIKKNRYDSSTLNTHYFFNQY
jgi:hypothetical protein